MATASDRARDLARVGEIEKDSQKGSHGAKIIKKGPAYGGGLKNYGKGTKKIAGG